MTTITINDLKQVELSDEYVAKVKGGAAFDAFLEIDGIKGETEDKHRTEQYAINFTKL